MKAYPAAMRYLRTCALLLSIGFALSAEEPADPYQRTSPQSSALAFLEACKSKDYTRALRYLDMSKLPADTPLEKRISVVQQLEATLEHDPQFDAAALSAAPAGNPGENRERVAAVPLNGKTVDLQMERVKLRSGTWVWKFAADSVVLIPQLAKAANPSPLERHMPDVLVTWKFANTSAWQWIGLVLLGAGIWGIAKLFGRLLPLVLIPLSNRAAPRMSWTAFSFVMGPAELLIAAALYRAGMEWIDPPLPLYLYLTRALSAVWILGLAWLCIGALDLGMIRLRGSLGLVHPRFSSSVLPLMARVVKVAALAFALIAVLSSWGYNTNTLLAGLGIGGVAIALAAQKTIENLFGGVAVVSDQPVFVGDFCKFGESVGTVEDIGLRSTRIRTLDRTLVTIPNAQFSSMSLENFSRRDKMLFHPMLNLRRDTTPAQVRSILEAIHRILTEDRRIEAGNLPVRFIGVGSYSLDVEVFCYILTGDGNEFLRIQQELLLRILDTVTSAGTALALPTQASVVYSAESPALASR
jgi:MscS family membrane protein